MLLKFRFTLLIVICSGAIPHAGAADIRYEPGERRDPFLPLVGPGGTLVKKTPSGDLRIEGIIYDPAAESLALINGEFYKEGETVHNFEIAGIFKDRIVLKDEEEEKTLWIQEKIEGNEGEKTDDFKSPGEKS